MKIVPAPAQSEDPNYFDPYDLIECIFRSLVGTEFKERCPDLWARLVHLNNTSRAFSSMYTFGLQAKEEHRELHISDVMPARVNLETCLDLGFEPKIRISCPSPRYEGTTMASEFKMRDWPQTLGSYREKAGQLLSEFIEEYSQRFMAKTKSQDK